ncbi:3-oxoacyl-[acyl-carrier-protein] reductase [Nitrosomonas sp.]|uniref:3-oxoacyl-[acyl-carrier-protein] reductase n=1 Tax=Nitrosomonas sp. TaxID=42353 RepID=UPI001DA0D0F3|nr:3-oxoacyl-[acyl-carrier-protein] reductase [Nitrosomonas sp.]MBX3617748.1 3-oxoacyl-[acyl-carrier-protein] reductase [Nitrosomonas sp.]
MNSTSRVVLITGASRGIGRNIAIEFALLGNKVAINYCKSAEKAEELCREIRVMGGEAKAYRANVASTSEVEVMVDLIESELGPIDVLVNNAGILKDNYLVMMSDQAWDDVIDINLKGTFLCSRNVAKKMMPRRQGKIINMVSISGLVGTPGQANYAASKGGVIAMTRSMARELGRYGITVNAVAPGFIETEMLSGLNQKQLGNHLQTIPLGRMGTTEEVAKITVFIASKDNSYMTGQIIVVDGGLSV